MHRRVSLSVEQESLKHILESVNWVYACFWQISHDRSSVVWADGYYRGPPRVVDSLVQTCTTARRRLPTTRVLGDMQAGLRDICFDNISNTEWFYMLSSNFNFPLGTNGAPVKIFRTGGFQWVCDAGDVSVLSYTRSNLAKEGGIKTDKSSVLDNIIDLVDELQCRVVESESAITFVPHGSRATQDLEMSSNFSNGFLRMNHASLINNSNHEVYQYRDGREVEINEGSQTSLMKLSDSWLDTREGLEGVMLCVVDDVPRIEVRMIEDEQVMIKLSSKDRPGLLTDIMFALHNLQLHVQRANIRTISGLLHDVLAAKVDVLLAGEKSTSDIAEAIRQAMEKGNTCDSLISNQSSQNVNLALTSNRKRSRHLI